MRASFISLLLWLSVLCCSAQNYDPAYPHVTVMTPEAAALGKYSDIPVSYYTGVPNISIPLYTINVDGFVLPITLSYHSAGIRADQEATWVGLGWTLEVGGRITRTAKGTDDFQEYGHDPSHPWYLAGYYDAPDIGNLSNLYQQFLEGGQWAIVNRKIYDSEPDIFYYNIPGYSGKFLLDKSRGAVLFNKSDNLKIEVLTISNPTRKVFKVTDPEGNRYFFNTREHSSYYSSNGWLYKNTEGSDTRYDCDTEDFTIWLPTIRDTEGEMIYEPSDCVPYRMPSCWCLTQIVTRTGRVISFGYTSYTEYLPSQESTEVYNNNHTSNQFYSKAKVVNEGWQLSSITWDFGSVAFTTSSREDINGTTKKLDRITIKNTSNQTLRQYQFDYTYFNNDYSGNSQYAYVFKRLKLLSLRELNTGEKHQFSYHEGSFPAKNTKNVDYWGIQNGRNYGSKYQIGVFVGGYAKYKGVQKEANYDKAVIGMLEQIQYPTGGYARFTYELNKFGRYYSFITNNNTAADYTGNENEGTGGASLTGFQVSVYNDYVVHEHPNLPSEHTETFQLTGRTLVTMECHMENHDCYFRDPDYVYHDAVSQPLAHLKRLSPTAGTIYTYECPYVFERGAGNLQFGEGCEVDLTAKSFTLEAGTYEFKAYCPPKDVDAEWHVTLDRQTINSNYGPEEGGGLRIHTIETNAGTRYFHYPTGRLTVTPPLYYFGNRIGDGSSTEQCVVQFSEPRTPMSSFNNGNYVGYDWVEEELESDGIVSRIRHNYVNEQEELLDDNPKYPYSPVYINYRNGLETSTEYYEDDQLVRRVEYDYTSSFVADDGVRVVIDMGDHYNTDQMIGYYYRVEWPMRSMQKETLLYGDEERYIIDTYFYTYNSHDLPLEVSHTVDGTAYTQHFRYPFDLNDNISLSMTRNNIIKQPVETFNKIGNLVFSGTKTEYKDSAQLFMPSRVYTLETVNGVSESGRSGSYSLNVEYATYSPHGNILQISERGKTTSYIWGYNYQYPVAEVKGATYAQVAAALGGTSAVEAFSSIANPSDSQVWQFLQPLLTGTIAASSLTSVYTYKPLVGMTSQTAPSGMRIYYVYDTAGRLIRIKDTDGNTVKQYQYHYKP